MLERGNNLEQILNRDLYWILIKITGRKSICMEIASIDYQGQLEQLYYCDINSNFLEMLDYVIEVLPYSQRKRIDLSSYYKYPSEEEIGENNLETWMLSEGRIFCFRKQGRTYVEARRHCLHDSPYKGDLFFKTAGITCVEAKNYCLNKKYQIHYNGGLFFKALGITLGECLESLNKQMDLYDLSILENISNSSISLTPKMIEKHLAKSMKKRNQQPFSF